MVYDPYEVCPYDEAHSILRSRMAYHLIRCSKQHLDSKKKVCPYDARHLIDPSEFQHHVNNCPTREGVVHFALHDPDEQAGLVPILKPEDTGNLHVKVAGENWDNDVEVKSYDPFHNIEERAIVRPLIGASKAVKREFRDQERRRIQQIENEKERQEKQRKENARRAEHARAAKIAAEKAEKEMKPLRRPKNLQSNKSLNDSVADSVANTSVTNFAANTSSTNPAANISVTDSVAANTSVTEKSTAPVNSSVPKLYEGSEPEHVDAASFLKSRQTDQQYVNTGAIPKSYGGVVANTSVERKSLKSDLSFQPNVSNGAMPKNTGAIPKTAPPKTEPFSYANALNKKISTSQNILNLSSNTLTSKVGNSHEYLNNDKSIDSDYDVIVEGEIFDTDKENLSNCSFVTAQDSSIIEKLAQDVHNLSVDDEGYQMVNRKLNKKMNSLKKKLPASNVSTAKNNGNTADLLARRQNRIAANFTNN